MYIKPTVHEPKWMAVYTVSLGVAVGGFWAMSIPITMRLVPEKMVPIALSIIFAAVTIATVLSAPLGSFLDGLIGWRNVFI